MRRRRRRKRGRGREKAVAAPAATPKRVASTKRPLLHTAGIALAVVLFAAMGDAAPAKKAVVRVAAASPAKPLVTMSAHAIDTPVPTDPPPWAAGLAPVSITNRNTGVHADVRLYSAHGSLELAALKEVARIACTHAVEPDDEVDEPLDARLVQLAVRASYHFDAKAIEIVSATRKGAHGKHGAGEALDFKLQGVTASALAAYVRRFPRAGIGIYTHPKTQYVHVDVREHSYHWIDGSPPGVTWREQLLADPKREERDASYVGAMDLPEAASP